MNEWHYDDIRDVELWMTVLSTKELANLHLEGP